MTHPVDPVALAQALHRRVGIQRDNQAGAQRGSLRQVGHMTAVQDVETAIGEHQRPGQQGGTGSQLVGRADLGFKSGGGVGHGRKAVDSFDILMRGWSVRH